MTTHTVDELAGLIKRERDGACTIVALCNGRFLRGRRLRHTLPSVDRRRGLSAVASVKRVASGALEA